MEKNQLNLLALDLGSSNGRGILGRFDGKKITLEEIHRFENSYIEMGGMVYWDILHIFSNIKCAFQKFGLMDVGALSCFGIDAWGNDYGLIDKNGYLLSDARSARHTTAEDMDRVHKIIPGRELFYQTGNSSYTINTLYQLYRRVYEGDPGIENAQAMLMIPDLLAFFCTGELHSEYTISTTTAMYNPTLKDWNREAIRRLGIPEHILQPLMPAGTLCGELLPSIAETASLRHVPCALVGSHDTASAVAAVPVSSKNESYAFCSSGTWSLFGIETDSPIFQDEMYENGFSNEGTVQGGFRPLKNITGLWLLQECRKEWKRNGKDWSYGEITAAAELASPLRSLIDPSHSDFFGVTSMPTQIAKYCKRTGQPVPETEGALARCIYESLALKYRWTIEHLESLTGKSIEHIYIVGGGTQNKLLNQMTADCTGKPVTAGPIEGACVGNLLTQAMALGEIANIGELREVVRNSFVLEEYEPKQSTVWDDASERMKIISKDGNISGI
ncbi:rhamnulokinase [Christensenella intestinihominis]|uniref:rhamnulokinase n=1 Tax=Christensenella intestinihominis TaxID=1851429 RepID=UPI000833ACCC|nr:rhamnulokinase family protein [Christensenella intestinihominis]